jgi:hypothetical protein
MKSLLRFTSFALGLVCALPVLRAEPPPVWETMKYGLFVHFVFGGEFRGMTPLGPEGGFPPDLDAFAEAFEVERFAADVASMGFEYVIFTAWHANMNVLYPSEAVTRWRGPGHATTRRDLLGEIIDALAARGIETSLYSHIWVGHDFHPEGGGFFSYDNKEGIITEDQRITGYVDSVLGDSSTWDRFVGEVYGEMSARYGEKVCAYWFDSTWTRAIDKQNILDAVRAHHPTVALVANGTADHGLPYSSKEVGSPEDTAYGFNGDYPPVERHDVTTWPSYERHIAIIHGGNWWAEVGGQPRFSPEDIFRFTVLQAGTNNNGGVAWSFSPFVDGSWEGDMLARMRRVNAYLEPVAEGIKRTLASPAFPTPEGSRIATLPHGFVATRAVDGRDEFLHVLVPPEGRRLELPAPADGSRFERASLLVSGDGVPLRTHRDGTATLTLPEGAEWDPLNTVFRLERVR